MENNKIVQNGGKMDSHRKTAIIVGVLFLVAMLLAMINQYLLGLSINDPDYLTAVSANENQVLIGVLLALTMTASVVGISIMMFPIFKKQSESLALGYVGVRIFEGFFDAVGAIIPLLLITLSQEFVAAGAPDATYFQTLGALLRAVKDWTLVLVPIVFGLGALVFYYLSYQLKLIPRWLIAWGFVGATLVLASGLLGMFGDFLFLLALPITVQEMVLAVWLIVKGFNSSAIAS